MPDDLHTLSPAQPSEVCTERRNGEPGNTLRLQRLPSGTTVETIVDLFAPLDIATVRLVDPNQAFIAFGSEQDLAAALQRDLRTLDLAHGPAAHRAAQAQEADMPPRRRARWRHRRGGMFSSGTTSSGVSRPAPLCRAVVERSSRGEQMVALSGVPAAHRAARAQEDAEALQRAMARPAEERQALPLLPEGAAGIETVARLVAEEYAKYDEERINQQNERRARKQKRRCLAPASAPAEDAGAAAARKFVVAEREHSCAMCGDATVSLQSCGACGRVWYCGKECQASHWWPAHYPQCVAYCQQAEREAGESEQ